MKNSGMYPFLFYVPKKSNQIQYDYLKVENKDMWVVKIANFDYSPYKSGWMGDDDLGDVCLVPDVDISEQKVVFSSEEDALQFIAEWWKGQLD